MVIIEASSGPCVFIESAPSMLSPSSICTSAFASGPRPIPPYSFGTKGHHRPCARAFFRSGPSTSASGLVSSFLFRRNALVVHEFADLLADRLGFGRNFEIDRHGTSSFRVVVGWVRGWHKPHLGQRQRRTKFEARRTR